MSVAPLPASCILKFTAAWCGPCQQVSPLLAKDAQLRICTPDDLPCSDSARILVLEVDVDRYANLCEHYNITALPTIKFLKNESVVEDLTVQGADLETILRNIERYKKKMHHIDLPICKEAGVTSW